MWWFQCDDFNDFNAFNEKCNIIFGICTRSQASERLIFPIGATLLECQLKYHNIDRLSSFVD